jgi:hypothetical protein
MPNPLVRVNLGGEGEVPGVINQQGPWVLGPTWRSSRDGKTLQELLADGHVFVIADNLHLPFPDDSVDEVLTNSVPIDTIGQHGPGVQSSEIRRILKSGGTWLNDGIVSLVKP